MPPSLKSRNDKSMCDRLPVMWTKEEDDVLREQVKLHGIDKWAKIATQLCGKTSRHCRRRWHMFLNVVNKRGGWSADEDELLLEAHRKFGNRWTEIAKKLPGRTDNAVKNRFCVLCKKQTKEAEVSPLPRPTDSGVDTAKQQLPERRLLQGPKATTGNGANKKMRTEANHKRKPEVAVQQRHLEETLQQWKGLQSSEALTCSPHQVSREGSLPPWDSVESNVVHRNTQADKFPGWMGLAAKGKGRATHPQMQPRETVPRTVPQWDGSQSGAGINDLICSTSSLVEEAQSFSVQSHIPSISTSCHSRLTQENLQQWKRANLGDGIGDRPHHQKMLKTSHSTWSRAKSLDAANNLLPQQKSDTELLRWWKGLDISMMSNVARQHTQVQEALPHWEQNPQDCVTASLKKQNPIDENLPALSELGSLPAAYMSNSTACTVLTGMRGWSMVQPGKPGEHVQQSTGDGTQTWDRSLAKEANANTANTRSTESMHEWQDWESTEVGNYSLGQNGPLEHTMEIDNPAPDDSAESCPLEASVKTLPMWTRPNCQQAGDNTVLDRPEGHETHEWTKSEIPTKSPRQLLEDKLQQLENSRATVHPGPLVSMLSRFAGSESKSIAHLLSAQAERQGRNKSQFIAETWKTAVEKLKCKPATFSSNTKTQSPRGVLGFEEFMSGGSKESDLETAAAAIRDPCQTSKADDFKWKSRTNVKDCEDGEMITREGSVPETTSTCEACTDVCGVPNDEVKLMTTEGEASRATEPPTPDIRTDGAHSPTQFAPRSHLTMECMPSPQFSDSEKEFLLSTLALDQTTRNCWSGSPLRPPSSRFSKVRNPLIDIRYDTPARSPLSSRLLRQFQVTDTPNLA